MDKIKILEKFKKMVFLRSFSFDYLFSMLTLYAEKIGLSKEFIGTFNGVNNFLFVLFQFIGGKFVKNNSTKKIMFFISLVLWSFSSLMFYFSRDNVSFLLTISIKSISEAFITLFLLENILNTFEKREKTYFLTIITFVANIGSLIGIVTSGFIATYHGFSLFFFFIPSIFNIFILFFARNFTLKKQIVKRVKSKYFNKSKFYSFLFAVSLFLFAKSIASPYFPILFIQKFDPRPIFWSFVRIFSIFGSITFTPALLKLVKKYNEKILLTLSTTIVSFTPLAWIIIPKTWIIYLYTLISGTMFSFMNILFISQLSNLVKNKEAIGETIGLFSLVTGLSDSLGMFVGSLLVEKIGLINLFILSFVLRFAFSSYFFLEKRKSKRRSILVENIMNSVKNIFIDRLWISFSILIELFIELLNHVERMTTKLQ